MDRSLTPSDFWAKLKYKDDDRSTGTIVDWHPLLAHSADVAAVTEALLTRTILRDRLASLIGWDDLSDVHIARLSALAALHDAGKVNHSFQDQAFPDAPRSKGHVQPIVNILKAPLEWQNRLFSPLQVDKMVPWFSGEKELTHFLMATWAHHGECVEGIREQDMSHWEPNARDPTE